MLRSKKPSSLLGFGERRSILRLAEERIAVELLGRSLSEERLGFGPGERHLVSMGCAASQAQALSRSALYVGRRSSDLLSNLLAAESIELGGAGRHDVVRRGDVLLVAVLVCQREIHWLRQQGTTYDSSSAIFDCRT